MFLLSFGYVLEWVKSFLSPISKHLKLDFSMSHSDERSFSEEIPPTALAKNPYPGLKFKICKIFKKRIFLKGPKCCSCFHMDPSIRKDIASSKVLQSTTTKSMFVTKRYSDFFQQNSCFVYLPQVGIPSHVLLSPAQLEGQEELL